MTNLPVNIFRFILLVFLQVLLFNNIQVSGYLNPYIYVLFILLLPFKTPPWLLLVLSFLIGLSVDAFSDTLGMHASASVLMAYLRLFVLNILAQRDAYDTSSSPSISDCGLSWFVKYSLSLIFFHHLFLFFIEVFSFSNFTETLIRILSSVSITFVLVILSQFFVLKKK